MPNTKKFFVAHSFVMAAGSSRRSSAASSLASSSLHSLSRSVVFTSVEPRAMAVSFEVCGSISMCTSTVSAAAPLSTALSIASALMERISSGVGLGTTRSTTSLTIAKATPMEDMTSALSGMEYFKPILSEQKPIKDAAPPPTPTRLIWSFSRRYFSASSIMMGWIFS